MHPLLAFILHCKSSSPTYAPPANREPTIAFPPSYRRRKQEHPLPPEAWADAGTLRSRVYTVKSGEGDTAKTRKPAYCDRVMVHSLAGLESQVCRYRCCMGCATIGAGVGERPLTPQAAWCSWRLSRTARSRAAIAVGRRVI